MISDTNQDLIPHIDVPPGRIGFFAVGHEPYWEQFAGLKQKLEANAANLKEQIKALGVEVVDAGFVDSSRRAARAGDFLRTHPVELLFCYVATYATSAVLVPVVQRSQTDVVLLGLQPSAGMDCRAATTFDQLLHDNVTSLPEMCNALIRCRRPPLDVVVGMLRSDDRAYGRISDWCKVATVLRTVRNARVGYLGHTYEGMLDMHSDPTMFHAAFGLHVEMLEMCDLLERSKAVTAQNVEAKIEEIKRIFCFAEPGKDPIAGPVQEESLRWSAKVAAAMDRLVEDFGLTALAYYYRGLNANIYERLVAGAIIGNSILTGRGIPVAGEADLKTCLAMLMMDRLGAGGSFAEFHPVDFTDDIVLVGHDGPAHIRISDQRPVIRDLSVYHGKRGHGLSVEFKVRTGPVTLFGLTSDETGQFKMVLAKGESLPGEIPATGNTNTRVRFPSAVADFVEKWSLQGPTHHFALGVGDQRAALEKVGRALGIKVVDVS